MITVVPETLAQLVEYSVAVIDEMGGDTYFTESGIHILRVQKRDDMIEVKIAVRSTEGGQVILRDAQRFHLDKNS